MQKHVVREKSCNYVKNVNFNRKIKGLLNRKGKKFSREKKCFYCLFFCFVWKPCIYSKAGELAKGCGVLQFSQKSVESMQKEKYA